VRATFSPIFTSGKMKGMLGFVKTTADNLVNELDKFASSEEEAECKKVYGCYTMDGLASAAFGMDINSFEKGNNSLFTKYAESLFKMSAIEAILMAFKMTVPGFPYFLEGLNINIWKKKETKFFYEVILSTIKTRREGRQERRNDLVDLMMDSIKQDIKLEEDEKQEEQYEKDMKLEVDKKSKSMDEDVLVATAMIFMMAGYDTTATLLSYGSYALAKNPEAQTRLQEEVDEAFADADGGEEFPDYSVIQALPYLDMVVHETLRLYAPVPMNNREATMDYRIPGTEVHLKKGDLLSFSVEGLHRDPAHWSHPEEFYPEHFSKEEKATRSPYAFQAFGQGPRNCIGMRFALLEAKVALLAVCRRFTFLPGTKMKEPLRQDPNSQLGWPKGGIWVNVQRR